MEAQVKLSFKYNYMTLYKINIYAIFPVCIN